MALGHLGEEGKAALHAIISHTYNYRPEVTSRHIERLPASPISCPRLRELHPEAAALGTCRCEFGLRGRGYPTPLLLALKVGEVPAFRAERGAGASPGPAGRSAEGRREAEGLRTAGGAGTLLQEAEDKLARLAELRRHQRGIEAAVARLRGELAGLFEAAGADHLDLAAGRLRRVRREGGEGWDFVIEV